MGEKQGSSLKNKLWLNNGSPVQRLSLPGTLYSLSSHSALGKQTSSGSLPRTVPALFPICSPHPAVTRRWVCISCTSSSLLQAGPVNSHFLASLSSSMALLNWKAVKDVSSVLLICIRRNCIIINHYENGISAGLLNSLPLFFLKKNKRCKRA